MQIGVETSKAVDQRRVFVIDDDEITRAALQFMTRCSMMPSASQAFLRSVPTPALKSAPALTGSPASSSPS